MSSRKIIFIMLGLIAVLASCNNKFEAPKKGEMFSISGTLNNSPYDKIYLAEFKKINDLPTVVDSMLVKENGVVDLKAVSVAVGTYGLFVEENNMTGIKGLMPILFFVNDAKKITFELDWNKRKEYVIKNSAKSTEVKNYFIKLDSFMANLKGSQKLLDSLHKSKKNDTASIMQAYSSFELTQKQSSAQLKQIIEKVDIGGLANLYFTIGNSTGLITPEDKNDMMIDLRKKFPEYFNMQAPELTMQNPLGKTIKISDYKGKYTLIDFWASWCGPCRAENPNVVDAFNKYKQRKFTVLGVSLDEDLNAWQMAIQQDGLTWEHMSDLKGWSSSAVELYQFNGIPYNVLIDPDGNIIASGLRGETLLSYLDKTLPK
jgi:peroxiredoxin